MLCVPGSLYCQVPSPYGFPGHSRQVRVLFSLMLGELFSLGLILPFLPQLLPVLQRLCMCHHLQAAFPALLYFPLPPKTSGTGHLCLWCRAFLGKQPTLTYAAHLSSLGLEVAVHTFASSAKFKTVVIEIFFDYSSPVYTMKNTGKLWKSTKSSPLLPLSVFILLLMVYIYIYICLHIYVYACVCMYNDVHSL